MYGHLSHDVHFFHPRVPITHPEVLSLPVNYVTNPTDLNGAVMYNHSSYAIPSVENHHVRDLASSVDNSTDGLNGGSEQQWSSEDTHNHRGNLLFQPHGNLMSGEVPVTRWSQNGPWVVLALAGVILLMLWMCFLKCKFISY